MNWAQLIGGFLNQMAQTALTLDPSGETGPSTITNRVKYKEGKPYLWHYRRRGTWVDDLVQSEGRRFFTINTSSNVTSIAYDWRINKLWVTYGQPLYEYWNVNPDEAADFGFAASKGIWVWDHLRVRGTVFGFKKPYRRIR